MFSRSSDEYNEEKTRMWDIGGDDFDTFQGTGILDFSTFSLDELTMESVLFADDGEEENEEVIGLTSTSSWFLRYGSDCNFVLNLW